MRILRSLRRCLKILHRRKKSSVRLQREEPGQLFPSALLLQCPSTVTYPRCPSSGEICSGAEPAQQVFLCLLFFQLPGTGLLPNVQRMRLSGGTRGLGRCHFRLCTAVPSPCSHVVFGLLVLQDWDARCCC